MPRFKIERVTEDEADILVEGRVTLYFRSIEGCVRNVASSAYDRKPAVVSRKDFLDARRLAIKEMEKVVEEPTTLQEESGISNWDIANLVLKNATQNNLSVATALDIFLKSATWVNPDRRSAIMQEVGKIGGTASARKAGQRRKRKEEETEKKRQGTFSFT